MTDTNIDTKEKLNKIFQFVYNDVKLHAPSRYIHDNLLIRFKENRYEKEESNLVNTYCDSNDDVLELGSCLGYVASILSKKCNSVISFEANPELKDSLELTKTINNLNNVTFINKLVSNSLKTCEFKTYDNIVAGSADRTDNGRGWGDSLKNYTIDCIKLNDILGINKVNCLIMDIEGGELKFLSENIQFIKNKVNKIIIELHGHLMNDNTFDEKCIKILTNNGFKIIQKIGISYYFESEIIKTNEFDITIIV